jgi:hypothetical protein
MNYLPVKILIVLIIFARPIKAEEAEVSPAIKELCTALLSKANLPVISISIDYKSQSVLDFAGAAEAPLKDQVAFASSGTLDLATGKLKFGISSFREREADNPDSYIDSTGQIAFDGTKWVYVRQVAKNVTPEVSSVTRVSSSPPLFLSSEMSHLAFPLFANLLKIQIGHEITSLPELLSDPTKVANLCQIAREGNILSLTIRQDPCIDILKFDITKGFALISRVTRFSAPDSKSPKAESRLTVTKNEKIDGCWLPVEAEIVQYVDSNIKVKRTYKITAGTMAESNVNYDVPIPSRSIVTDDRFGFSFLTK